MSEEYVPPETAPLQESELNEPSRRLLAVLLGRPQLSAFPALMQRDLQGGWSLLVEIPSPSADPRRDVAVWMDESLVPAVEFGGWHTHADLWDSDPDVGLQLMLDQTERILAGRILLIDPGSDQLPRRVLDLDDESYVLDELTWPGSPDSIALLSWSGADDDVLSAENPQVGLSNNGFQQTRRAEK